MKLKTPLQELGMKSAFDEPVGRANFDRMAAPRPGEHLYIEDVYHKAFINIDEEGTEAAAATAVFSVGAAAETQKPIAVKIDRTFIFAIIHPYSQTCLFLGRVMDPRLGH